MWNSRPFQQTKPSTEMQLFAQFLYAQDYAVDASVTISIIGNTYVKFGLSRVLSPNKNIDATYVHAGGGASTPSILPINFSFSVGVAKGIKDKASYAKNFIDVGGGMIFGIDYCMWPDGASAYSFTVSSSYGAYAGWDYYWCIN